MVSTRWLVIRCHLVAQPVDSTHLVFARIRWQLQKPVVCTRLVGAGPSEHAWNAPLGTPLFVYMIAIPREGHVNSQLDI